MKEFPRHSSFRYVSERWVCERNGVNSFKERRPFGRFVIRTLVTVSELPFWSLRTTAILFCTWDRARVKDNIGEWNGPPFVRALRCYLVYIVELFARTLSLSSVSVFSARRLLSAAQEWELRSDLLFWDSVWCFVCASFFFFNSLFNLFIYLFIDRFIHLFIMTFIVQYAFLLYVLCCYFSGSLTRYKLVWFQILNVQCWLQPNEKLKNVNK